MVPLTDSIFLANAFLLKEFLKKFVHKKSISVDIAFESDDYVISTVGIACERSWLMWNFMPRFSILAKRGRSCISSFLEVFCAQQNAFL